MSKKGHVPTRTCMGCRGKKEKKEMVRFSHGPEGLVLAEGKKGLSGRGFYLCPDLLCLKMAQKKTQWGRSLESIDHRIFCK